MTEKHFPTSFQDSALHCTILLSDADVLLKNRDDKDRYLMPVDLVCQGVRFPAACTPPDHLDEQQGSIKHPSGSLG